MLPLLWGTSLKQVELQVPPETGQEQRFPGGLNLLREDSLAMQEGDVTLESGRNVAQS